MREVDLPQLDAVDLEKAAVLAVDALQQPGDRALARPAAPDDAQHGASRDVEAHLVERRQLGTGIGEGQTLERDVALELGAQATLHRRSLVGVVQHRRDLAD